MRVVMLRFAALMAAAMLIAMLGASSIAAASPTWSHRDARVCASSAADQAACASVARVVYADGAAYDAQSPADLGRVAKAAASVSYTAVGIRTAYGITAQGDPSRVVAIVDAYDDVNAYSHLSTYRSSMGLPAIGNCSLTTLTGLTSASTSPCFSKVDQAGGTSYPAASSGWSNEIDLDLQAASAVCPRCSIVLLEASTASFANLGTAVTTASNTAHVLAISNSYGSSGDVSGASYPAWDNAAKKGLAVMASTGDGGYGASFPASGTYVIAVGGTTLAVDSTTGARIGETAWSGAGSGCSTYNAAGSWQVIAGSPCGTKKAMADLSADADPSSGLQVYTTYNGTTGWWIFGGTSLSSPLMGALYTLQGYNTAPAAYAWAATTPYYDVTSGSNGTCSPAVLCTAGTGWDGPTGRGSIQLAAVSQTLTSISVSPSSASVLTGGTQQFTATGLDQSGSPMATQPTFVWTVSGGGTISGSGLFTAGATAGGPFTVTANGGGLSGTASVTVTAARVLTSITVNPSSASVQVGSTWQFGATGYDQTGAAMSPQPQFTWAVSGGGTINSAGVFTATTPGGPFTVSASTGGVIGTASVTVPAPVVDFSLSVSPPSQSVKRGSTATYTVTVNPLNGFTGSVSLTLTGAPSGTTVTFSPNPTATGATLTIKTVSRTRQGNYALTINGTFGSLSHSVTASLKVTK